MIEHIDMEAFVPVSKLEDLYVPFLFRPLGFSV